MALDLSKLDSASRLLLEAELSVAKGTGGRFQPTGFPDLGPALYKGVQASSQNDSASPATMEIVDMLLIESVQSMANRLEEVCLQGEDYNSDCQGIPYVRVLDGNRNNTFLTSSVREPHRLNSPYVMDAKRVSKTYKSELTTALAVNKSRPVHIWKIVPAIFERDPGCVLHGVFFEKLDGRIRLPRLVSACIEASAPNQANSSGVYRGEVTAADNIPYPRQEFTSTSISATFIFHLSTLRGYNLDEPKNVFLQTWAMYKIDRFLRQHLRLRTACEFDVRDLTLSLDGQKADLGYGIGKWPASADIRQSFLDAKRVCFPEVERKDGESVEEPWEKRRVAVVTHSIDVQGIEKLPHGLAGDSFVLDEFSGRAEVKTVTEGKGKKAKSFDAFVITGEWSDEDQARLKELHPAKVDDGNGNEIDSPAHEIVAKTLKKWNGAWKKLQKAMDASEQVSDGEDE